MDEDKSADKPDKHSAENDEENLTQNQLAEILSRVNYMERVLRDQLSRLYEIEMRMGITPAPFRPPVPPQMPPQPARPVPPQHPVDLPQWQAADPSAQQNRPSRPPMSAPPTSPSIPKPTAEQQTQGAASQPPGQTAASVPSFGAYGNTTGQRSGGRTPDFAPPAPSKNHSDLEAQIGGNWFSIIGVLIIVFGVGFFLKYAFDSGWITPLYRVWTGILVGVAFLATGEWLRKKYATYAYGLTGGGILTLYLTAWASFKLYNLYPQRAVFVFMALITATAVLLAARYNTLIIAILGLIGGFLTPILLSTGVDNQTGLFGYIILLDLGVLALAFTKQWRSLNYMSFAATVLMTAAWMGEWYAPEKLWLTITFLTILFVIFALLAILYNVINKRPTGWLDLGMVFVNALLYFSTTYLLLNHWRQSGRYHAYLGGFAVLMSAFYGLLGYFTYSRDREDRLLILTFGGLAFLFLVLAVPIQFDQQWVTMAWAIEGAILTWIGLRVKDRVSIYAAMCVFGIAVFHWFVIDVIQFGYKAGTSFTPFWNPRALSCAVLVGALAAASWFYKRMGEHLTNEEREMFSALYLLGANAFTITLLSLDINSYFAQKKAISDAAAGENLQRIDNMHMFTLSALWAMYGAAALLVGITRRLVIIRFAALCLLGATALKVLAVDLFAYDSGWHRTIFNETFAAFAMVIAAFALGAWLYSRAENIEETERQIMIPVLVGAANLLLLIALSAEVIGHYNRALSTNLQDIEEKKQFWLSVLWTLYATAALTLGIIRGSKLLRIGGLSLLALTIFKLIGIDLSYYDAGWHTLIFNRTFGAYALMIVALAAGIWFYSRSEKVGSAEKIGIIPVMIIVANLLALLALSTEAWGYYDKQIDNIASVTVNSDMDYEKLADLKLAQQFALSIIWTIYGGAMMALGFLRRSLLSRIMALLLLSLTILKVFFLDFASLDKLYRIVLAIVLGLILLAVAFLYQRFRFISVNTKDDEAKAEKRTTNETGT
jgi:uncharacterized membrane protein